MTPDAERMVRRALGGPGGLRAHFQPIVDLQRGVVCGYEALTRFLHWQGSPEPVFLVAERMGLAGALEARVVRAALAARSHLPVNCFLTINLSPAAMLSPEVRAVLGGTESLDLLVIELTEQTDEDLDELRRATAELRSRGALIAVDDAGSGYGSLRRIAELRPQFVKVDRGLVTGLHDSPASSAVVEALGALASRIDAWLIAEGVETISDLDALSGLNVPLGQGWLFGRPTPGLGQLAPEVSARILERHSWRSAAVRVGAIMREAPVYGESDLGAVALPEGEESVVVVDAAERPVALLLPGSPHPRRSVMRVTPDMPAVDVMRRAMTRPASERFDPVLVWSDSGKALGVVPVDALAIAAAAG